MGRKREQVVELSLERSELDDLKRLLNYMQEVYPNLKLRSLVELLADSWRKSGLEQPTMPLPSLTTENRVKVYLPINGVAHNLLRYGGLLKPAGKTLRRIIVLESRKRLKEVKKEEELKRVQEE